MQPLAAPEGIELSRRSLFGSMALLVGAGVAVIAVSVVADELNLGSANGSFGWWQAAGVVAGAVAAVSGGLGLRLLRSGSTRLAQIPGGAKSIWLAPRLLLIVAAALVVVMANPDGRTAQIEDCPPLDWHEFTRDAHTSAVIDGTLVCWYSGAL
jgi:hypothetical protein